MKKQDSSNQREVIATYAKENNLSVDKWHEFNISGSSSNKKQRGITDLIDAIKDGDTVLISDIARLGRDNALLTLGTISNIVEKGAKLVFCYSGMTVTAQSGNDIAVLLDAVIKSISAVEFAKERSQKAKVAHARRKKAGLQVGRIKGSRNNSHKLDPHAVLIMNCLDKGMMKTKILEKLNKKGVTVARATLYNYINMKLNGKGIA